MKMLLDLLSRATAIGLVLASSAQAQRAPADDELLRRLQALEERVQQLEARNRELEESARQVAASQPEDSRGDTITPAVMVKSGMIPTIGDSKGEFTFKPRGMVQLDLGKYFEREGGFDFNGGTNIRRGRIGLEGTAFGRFDWRIEGDFAEGGTSELTDAYVAFTGIRNARLIAGQFKVPFGLEGNSSDSYTTFIENGMLENAFTGGSARRLGLGLDFRQEAFTLGLALTGDNNSVQRSGEGTNESYGVNARATVMPIRGANQLQLGLSGYWRSRLRAGDVNDTIRVGDRPNVRIDNTRIADSGTITQVDDVFYLAGEIVGSTGPFSLQAEYGQQWVNRYPVAGMPTPEDLSFSGFYLMGSWLITGEQRPVRNGVLDRIRPRQNFSRKDGGWGAWELAFRYDQIDLTESPGSRAGNEAHTYTTALNWYMTPNIKLMTNWIRFTGRNSPLDPEGDVARGDVLVGRFHLDF